MTTYTDVFGGANVYPSDVSYTLVVVGSNITLVWPDETSKFGFPPLEEALNGGTVRPAARIIDLFTTADGCLVSLPDATKASVGETILFVNRGSYTATIVDHTSISVIAVEPGTAQQVYLYDNATAAGLWNAIQYGSTVSVVSAYSLVGNGITASGSTLQQSMPVVTFTSDYTAGTTDRAKVLLWKGSSGSVVFPSTINLGSNWFCHVRNSGSGDLTLNPAGSVTIDGGLTLSLQPGESATVFTDGTQYYSIGYGRSATFAFDYAVVNVAGTGTYTLTGTELNRVSYKFTGTLTGNRDVVVPATIQQYWVDNQTSGAYTLTIKTAFGTGLSIAPGQRAIFYCDGVNVVDADTSTVSLPVQVSQGGTGAVSASAARLNLGATSLGDSIFTAASASTVWSALGVAPSGIIDGGTF